jgi:chaperone modulatory protein CbpM
MITIERALAELGGLTKDEIEDWVARDWLRPEYSAEELLFHEIDLARARLIGQLRYEMDVNDAAIPIVLSLLDQLYELRRGVTELSRALRDIAPEQLRRDLIHRLASLVR